MKNKKGQSLSLQTVIVAVLLLIVLVVVIFIFTKYIGQEGEVVNKSISTVGDCVPGDDDDCKLFDDLFDNADDGTKVELQETDNI